MPRCLERPLRLSSYFPFFSFSFRVVRLLLLLPDRVQDQGLEAQRLGELGGRESSLAGAPSEAVVHYERERRDEAFLFSFLRLISLSRFGLDE